MNTGGDDLWETEKSRADKHRNGRGEKMSTEKTTSPFIEEYRALVAAVEAFDHRDVDLTTLTDKEVDELDNTRLPLYSLTRRAYEERLRRIEVERQEEQEEQHNRKHGVGGKENEITDWDLIQVGTYEEVLVRGFFERDESTAVDEIRKCIPGITDAEIEQYRNGENPLTD